MARRARMVCCLGVILAALAAATPASADFSTETVTVPLQDTAFSIAVQVPQFQPDPNAVLEGVSIAFNGQASSADTLTFTNQATLELTTTVNMKLSGPDNLSLVAAPVADATHTASGGTFSTTVTGNASALQPESSDPALLATFTGTGNVDFTLAASAVWVFNAHGGNGAFTVTPQAGGTITVTYQYRAVPEPASLALLTMGGGGVMLAARRRRRPA